MTRRHLDPESPALLALLAALVALGPLTVDMYVPAMPAMKDSLGTDISSMHLTLSFYLAGFAIFHLLCGPLADRFGRRPVLISGTALFVAASLGCAFSTTVEELLVYRFVQGVGACVGPTLARTVARDVFGPTRAARALSLIAMLMALAPAIAPTLGAIMLLWLPWPIIFVFLAVYGSAMVLLIHVFLGESVPMRQSLHPGIILRNYRQLFRDPLYLRVTVGSAMIYAGLMTYLSSSSFVYISMLGVPVQYFGFIFLTSVIGYMAGSGLSARLTRAHEPEYIVLAGSLLAAGAGSAMLLGAFLFPMSVAAILAPMVFYSTAMGLVLPNAMAIALRPFPYIAGTASAMLGFIQMGVSGAASAIVGALLADRPEPMIYMMFLIALIALALNANLYFSTRETTQ